MYLGGVNRLSYPDGRWEAEVTTIVGRRRTEAVPPAARGELVRPRVVDSLGRRWEVPVTTLLAGAGFGKSTALAQAVRANHIVPRGIDVWFGCEPGDEDVARLAPALLDAVGSVSDGRAVTHARDGCPADVAAAATDITSAMAGLSPVPVCLIVDDVHELPLRSSGAALLAEVVRRLPANGHVLLAGRDLPSVPLARRRVAGQVADLSQDLLAFTATEVHTMAVRADVADEGLDQYAGWPALVRLALDAPPHALRRYVWEEVLGTLDGPERIALLALAVLGVASQSDLEHLCGANVSVEHLAARIPLVVDTGDGRVRAHDLWHDTLVRLLSRDAVRDATDRALALLLGRGEVARAGAIAVRAGDRAGLRAASLALVRTTLSSLPVDTARSWLAAADAELRRSPELMLLTAACRHSANFRDPEVDRLLDAVLAMGGADCAGAATASGGPAAAAELLVPTAIALAAIVAHTRGDHVGLFLVVQRARECGAQDDPVLQSLVAGVEAAMLELAGDVPGALAVLDRLVLAGGSLGLPYAVRRLRWHLLLLAGRADEAALAADGPVLRAVAGWLAGDPATFDHLVGTPRAEPIGPGSGARDVLTEATFAAVLAASVGDIGRVAAACRVVDATPLDLADTRDSAQYAVATAALAIATHDDAAAERLIGEHLARHPIGRAPGETHLRRFLAVPYVCSHEVRAAWDAATLGPSHERAREVARALLAARAGGLTATSVLPPAALVHAALPLPWAVELAARVAAVGNPGGAALAEYLLDRPWGTALGELRHAGRSDDVAIFRGVQSLLARVPVPPPGRTRVNLLGPLELVVDGVAVDRCELRRVRVRELLALLVVEPVLERSRAIDLLWPDLDPVDGSRNLRVTLTHLRKVLEPERRQHEAGYHVRADGERLRLVGSPWLEVDLWELRSELASADSAHRRADVESRRRHLGAAAMLWRGQPLTDLERLSGVIDEATHLRLKVIEAHTVLGELALADGATDAAVEHASRALAIDPYGERPLRLVLAAHLHRRDPVGVHRAVERLVATLDDLGVEPDAATAILLRQAACQPAGADHAA